MLTARDWSPASPLALLCAIFCCTAAAQDNARPLQRSGIYPHLSYANAEGECGTGAVVPWADRLWVITYGPHFPKGSSDKLYEITSALEMTTRPESVGGTPANRMIHRESGQLFIGPYAIDAGRKVRVIPPSVMPGRLTGTARHLSDPAGKIYYATMEEGVYEVDVRSLAVKELYADGNGQSDHSGALLPGYHGKGFYAAQGRLVYSNNGELSKEAQRRPDIASGCLAEWDGKEWRVVRRNQFTEVTGPGGIEGNQDIAKDPLWSVGWDHRSLILMLLDEGKWTTFRLPKSSHSYDGAHGWNTEWPRIREIGEDKLLMTMHGAFWKFPKTFSLANTGGIAPRSNYLKVIGDFCRWNDRLVFGCDDSAKSEFLNRRKAKGILEGPGKSHSNLWFVAPDKLDALGPVIGRGAVWLNDPVKSGVASEPFLFAGFEKRSAHLSHDAGVPVTFTLETGDGLSKWRKLRDIVVPAAGYAWADLAADSGEEWIRATADRDCGKATVLFTYAARDDRGTVADQSFAGLALPGDSAYSGGLLRARGDDQLTLHFASSKVVDGTVASEGYYEMGADLRLRRVDSAKDHAWLKAKGSVPAGVLKIDAASILITDDEGRRFRLPKGDSAFDRQKAIPLRVAREVATERDLLHVHGTFFELPAENAGGFAKMRPITTHNRLVTDYCSWRGLLVLSGISPTAPTGNEHIIRSDDNQCALWVGALDDLWKLGRPTGKGGPWMNSPVKANDLSDPYLMTAYEKKALTISHDSPEARTFSVEVDIDGTGNWKPYQTFSVQPGKPLAHAFPDSFQAYWIRFKSTADCTATALLTYE